MTDPITYAPGWPGIEARWTSSAKTGIGTARNRQSRIWFTLSHGILNEVYYPRVDKACTRDLGIVVTDGHEFFSEVKRHAKHQTTYLAKGVPAFRLENTCEQGRYRIEKEILTDPKRPVLLQRIQFDALEGATTDYHLYALLAPHLANHGGGNTGWVGEHEGMPMLFAERDGCALALACSTGWRACSVGFVGTSDSWQDLRAHKKMTWQYDRAENGNVALTGEVNVPVEDNEFVLALGFGTTPGEAAQHAAESLNEGFDAARDLYIQEWKDWQKSLRGIKTATSTSRGIKTATSTSRDIKTATSTSRGIKTATSTSHDLVSVSAAVIRTCESKEHPGGIVASLSLPWGFSKGDGDLGGYHLVWPRDLVETAGALLAIGATEDTWRVLSFLESTQNDDGHWSQNMWIDGVPYWTGVQLDETAFPILLVDLMRRQQLLKTKDVKRLWPMLQRAATYLVVNGPVTLQDRWEEDPGYSPFTLAVTIAALLAAADFADIHGQGALATYLLETADCWNDSIERWTYVTDTDLTRHVGVEGCYVRIAPPEVADAASPTSGFVPIKNRPPGQNNEAASNIISPDALAFVRFGLRAADDPRILNTVNVIDVLLKVETPSGPTWRRYNDDGYGEHADGSAFDGVGIGRAWPLLTGERAHYELALGRHEEAERLLSAMESFANEGGLIPEQVWDAPDIPDRELLFGRPSGSAMPLVWAHAEYLKLRRSLQDGRVFDLPPQCVERYLKKGTTSPRAAWRFSHRLRMLPAGKLLRVEVLAPAAVHWSSDNWVTTHDAKTVDTGFGLHVVDLPTDTLSAGSTIRFTFHWLEDDRWEGGDFEVNVVS